MYCQAQLQLQLQLEWQYSQHPQPHSRPPEKYGMTSGMKHTTPTSTPSFPSTSAKTSSLTWAWHSSAPACFLIKLHYWLTDWVSEWWNLWLLERLWLLKTNIEVPGLRPSSVVSQNFKLILNSASTCWMIFLERMKMLPQPVLSLLFTTHHPQFNITLCSSN